MKNLTLFLARNFYKMGFWIFLSCYCSFAFAQKTSAVQYSKTDKTFANTTEIYKTKNATDGQILAEIEKDYGLGDIVRITDAPPPDKKPPVEALPKTEKIITAQTSASIPLSAENVQTKGQVYVPYPKDEILPAEAILEPTVLNIQTEKIAADALAEKQVMFTVNEQQTSKDVNRVENSTGTIVSNRASRSSSGAKVTKTKSAGKKTWFSFISKRSKPSKAIYTKKKKSFGCYKF